MTTTAAVERAPGRREDLPVLQEPPFFIVGSGRSGTTLMRSLLSSHSRLTVTPETHYLKSCIRLAGGSLDRPPADFDAFWRAYCETPRFASLGVTPDECAAHFPQDRRPSFADAFSALLRAYLDKTGKARVGEKTPSHLHQAEWLLAQYPDARIITMRRDPRAMISSLLGTPWRQGEDDLWRSTLVRRTRLHAIAKDARRWAWINGELLPRLETDPRIIAVSYEELVRDPEGVLRAVSAHLGEDFEPEMLDRRENRNVDPGAAGMNPQWTPWLRQHEASARSPVEASSVDKWREQLSEREVAVIEAYTGEVMRRFGYENLASTAAERRRAKGLATIAETACNGELGLRRAARRVIGPAPSKRSAG